MKESIEDYSGRMEITTRAGRVSAAFMRIAETLVDEYDILDLLHILVEECVDILDITAAGLMLIAPDGSLQVMASTNEESRLIELLQQESGAGPCIECCATGVPVIIRDISTTANRWPVFANAALAQGFRSVHAFPLRARQKTVGAMNLFRAEPGDLTDEDIIIGQALADVSTVSILQERIIRETAMVNNQLQRALNSRILIEQAKGVIAHLHDLDTDTAFHRLRTYARTHNMSLNDTAQAILDRTLTL